MPAARETALGRVETVTWDETGSKHVKGSGRCGLLERGWKKQMRVDLDPQPEAAVDVSPRGRDKRPS